MRAAMRAADRGVTAPVRPRPRPAVYTRGPGSAVTSAPPPGVWGRAALAAAPRGIPFAKSVTRRHVTPASLPFKKNNDS